MKGSQLAAQFAAYSQHGARRGEAAPTQITLSQSDKWLRQAEVIRPPRLTTTDTAILWRRLARPGIHLTFSQWLQFVDRLAAEKELSVGEVRQALVQCGKPRNSLIEFDSSELTTRLTDVSSYPHRHRSRFDCNGVGLGVAGTRDLRDLPLLWATASSEGLLVTCPSVLGAGRSCSPAPERKLSCQDVCRI